jgi:hypothetical protein
MLHATGAVPLQTLQVDTVGAVPLQTMSLHLMAAVPQQTVQSGDLSFVNTFGRLGLSRGLHRDRGPVPNYFFPLRFFISFSTALVSLLAYKLSRQFR